MAATLTLTQQELERLFGELADEWHDATGGMSVASRIVSHPAYLKIIGLGPGAIPLILADLRTRGGWWFAALEALTRESSPNLDLGAPETARAAWLRWGSENGY